MERVTEALIFFAVLFVVFKLADNLLPNLAAAAAGPPIPPASHAYRFG
jgi:hypothetical protein